MKPKTEKKKKKRYCQGGKKTFMFYSKHL